ncbi:MAG: hypothetical protein ACLTT1_05265, partial [[Clostridium] scindens]
MNIIDIQDITKDYGGGRGVFDIAFQVKRGKSWASSVPAAPERPGAVQGTNQVTFNLSNARN